jgi:hypothetical protein
VFSVLWLVRRGYQVSLKPRTKKASSQTPQP